MWLELQRRPSPSTKVQRPASRFQTSRRTAAGMSRFRVLGSAPGRGRSVTAAFLASRVLLRHLTGASEQADEVFGFARLPR